MRMSAFTFAAAIAFLGLGATSAEAGSISVNNYNFTTLPRTGLAAKGPQGPYSGYDGIPGWVATGLTGQWDPNGAVLSVPAGATYIAYSDGPTISQTVTPTVVAGDVYTLTVDVGQRSDIKTFTGGADLWIDGVAYDAIGKPVFGGWSVFTATYTGKAADAGDPITIQLTESVTGKQTDFSDVTLSFTDPAPLNDPPAPTPEPGTFTLAGLGLLCAMGYGVRKNFA